MSEVVPHPIGEPAYGQLWARVAKERALAKGALALVALHVIDDNFLQPEAGMSPGDHLVSGLVPLALLIGAAMVYTRLRSGARAMWALLAGFFGVLTGTEAVYYTLNGGPSGDDFTGIAATLGGFVLLVVGAVTLWRSRHSCSFQPRSPTSSRTPRGQKSRLRTSAPPSRRSRSRRGTDCGCRAGSSRPATAPL